MSGQDLFEILDELREAQQKSHEEYEAENDAWWNGLTEEEREDAFYAVCKRIHKADLVDRGTYRHTLYDVFGFDMNMYGRGMECRYMAIHNALYDGDKIQKMKRFEVIDIKYSSSMARLSDLGLEELFCFYPNGVWDEDKLLLSEAEKKYPRDKYRWIEICEESEE